MGFRRHRDPQEFPLSAALDAAVEAATRAGVSFDHRVEDTPPATSLVVSSPQPETAELAVSTMEVGVVYLDIGVGMHAEWLLRSPEELANALSELEVIYEAVFRGHVEERVWRRADGRHSIEGSVSTPQKTYRFRHLAVGLTAESGDRRYVPYPPSSP